VKHDSQVHDMNMVIRLVAGWRGFQGNRIAGPCPRHVNISVRHKRR